MGTMASTTDCSPADDTNAAAQAPLEKRPGRTVWTVLTGAIGAVGGIAPHVLHHVGPLVGTALVAGAGGTALFGVVSVVASLPMLLRLRRRFGSWWAPGIALVLFTGMFFFSSLVVGPLISGTGGAPTPEQTTDHDAHHD